MATCVALYSSRSGVSWLRSSIDVIDLASSLASPSESLTDPSESTDSGTAMAAASSTKIERFQ